MSTEPTVDERMAQFLRGDYAQSILAQEQGFVQRPVVPMARVIRTAGMNILHNTITSIPFTTASYDTDSMHSTTVNNTRLTCRTPGVYALKASVSIVGSDGSIRECWILLNGTTRIADCLEPNGNEYTEYRFGCSTDHYLDVDDYVELQAYHNAGATRTLGVGSGGIPQLCAHRIGGLS